MPIDLATFIMPPCRSDGGEQYIGRVELQLAQYIQAVLGWQGLGYALPHFAQAGDMDPLAAGKSVTLLVFADCLACKRLLQLVSTTTVAMI